MARDTTNLKSALRVAARAWELVPPRARRTFAVAGLLALLACLVPALLYVTARRMTGEQSAGRASHRCREQVDGMLVEQLGGIEYIRAANTEGQEVRRVADVLADWRRQQVRLYLRTASFH